MEKFLIGKKVGMTQVFGADDEVVPVTVIQAGPCVVLKVLTKEESGYNAILVGFDSCEADDLNKPQKSFYEKIGKGFFKLRKEFRVDSTDGFEVGQLIEADVFSDDQILSVRGKTMGRGFTGTIKRHNFSRGPMSHGSKSHRIPGSIGAGTTPSRVVKGKKMAGHYGDEFVTISGLKVQKTDKDSGLVYLVGAVPGKKGNLLILRAR